MSAVSNVKWVAVSQAARILSQLANIFVLARILPPSDYGLMAMATVVTNLALLIRDQGTSAAIIQKEDLTHHTINTVFWFNVMVGVVIALMITLCSPIIADYFKHDELIAILVILALIFPISSSSISHQALLERESKFKKLAFIELISSFIAMVVAVAAALYGAGVYSLVLQAILMALLSSLQLWMVSSWRPQGKPSWQELKTLLPFTGHMTAFQLITYFFRNADSMVIGRILGAASLGIYSMAYKVMLLPVQNITWASSRALLPVMSRQQNALDEMGKLYLQTIAFIAFLTAPLMAGIFALREPFVEIAFGHQWIQVSTVLAWLTPVGFVQSISSTTGTVFMAQGKTRLLMWFSLASALVHIIAYYIGASNGVTGVAEWYFYASVITGVPLVISAGRLVHCSPINLLKSIWKPAVVALLMCLSTRYAFTQLNSYWAMYVSFLIAISFGVVFYLLVSYLLFPSLIKSYLGKVFSRKN
jgi:PST family polysaccharide transporter